MSFLFLDVCDESIVQRVGQYQDEQGLEHEEDDGNKAGKLHVAMHNRVVGDPERADPDGEHDEELEAPASVMELGGPLRSQRHNNEHDKVENGEGPADTDHGTCTSTCGTTT